LPLAAGASILAGMEVGSPELLLLFGCGAGLLFPALFLLSLVLAITRKSRGWTVGAVVFGSLALLSVGGLVAAGVSAAVKSSRESAIPKDFTTSDGVAVVTGGPHWRDLGIGSDDASLGIGNPVREEYLVVVSEAKSDFPDGYTLRQFADLAGGLALAGMEDASVEEFREVAVNGLAGLRREVTGRGDGDRVFFLNTYVEGRAHFHQVMVWTLAERRDRARAALAAAADSFREKPAP